MLKKKPRRSREFKKNNQIIDFEEAREKRREKREQRLLQEQEERRLEEEKKLTKRQKRQRRNRKIVYTLAIGFIIFLMVYCVWDVIVLYFEKQDTIAEQERLIEQKEALQEELNNVNDPKYIEQQARLQLKLIMPGEILFILPPQLQDQGEEAEGEQTEEEQRE